jgi:hypothetical protein
VENYLGPGVTFSWCHAHAQQLWPIFHAVSSNGQIESQWWLDNPAFVALHPSFAAKHKGGSPVVSKWAKKFSGLSRITWVRYLGSNNSLWLVQQ